MAIRGNSGGSDPRPGSGIGEPPAHAAALPFPVVGVGASAGGLQALEELLEAVPDRPGVAIVIVTHQSADRESLLGSILRKHCSLPVATAEDGTAVEVDHVYLSKPGSDLALQGGVLRLVEPRTDGPHAPIDFFFESLAHDQRELAVGVVLSGTGSDGTRGLIAVKAGAGLTMAQDPRSASYGGMPSSAIDASAVDYVAPAAELPQRLLAYTSSPHAPWKVSDAPLSAPLKKVLVLLRNHSGTDFGAYKESTVRRRIERRMGIRQVESSSDYLRYAQSNPQELDALFKELLIGVTSFFRDPEAWSVLATALMDLCEERPEGHVFRGWVPGCSTGEEAYSLAIVLRECLERAGRAVDVQLFATDLDPEAIATARVGWYPRSTAFGVEPDRLRRFFTAEEDGFQVCRDIREMVVFAEQNVLRDPPFTRLDVLSCRNLLIYLAPEVQQRLLPLLHYGLAPDGLLALGPSESLGGAAGLFEPVDKRWRLFRRRPARVALAPVAPVSDPAALARPAGATSPTAMPHTATLGRLIEKHLLGTFAPATVVVDAEGHVAYVHGHTGSFLEPAQGQPTHDVLEMAREGLRLELPAALREARGRGEPVVRPAVRVKANGGFVEIRLTVRPIREPEALAGLFMITFEPVSSVAEASPLPETEVEAPDERVVTLERELEQTKQTHQVTVEELETSNEELKSTNEELQSTNEELQSANEELETSREEMQSLNEELQTVNAELQDKMDALSSVNDDMQNLLDGTDIATVFLDRDLRIKRFTEQARDLIKVIDGDVGRPIGDLAHRLRYDELVEDAAQVLRTLVPKEAEVLTKDDEWRLMRILPYRTGQNVIDGVVVTFIDIDAIKRAERASAEDRLLTQAVMDVGDLGFAVLDGELRVLRANRSFAQATEQAPGEVQGQDLFEIADGAWDVPELREMLENRVGRRQPTEARIGTGGTLVWARVGLVEPGGSSRLLLLVTDPVTPRSRREP